MYQVALLLLVLATSTAQGQVIKCTNPATGHSTYSDRPCEGGQAARLVEERKSAQNIMAERLQASEANERKYRNRLAEIEIEQREASRAAPVGQDRAPDNSASYECRLARREHETVSSIQTGTAEYRRNRINASTVKVNSICGLTTELMQPPPIVRSRSTTITHCDTGFCYDSLGTVYHRAGPGFMTGPNGRACHGSGTSWICN